jgi:hypothetical protein
MEVPSVTLYEEYQVEFKCPPRRGSHSSRFRHNRRKGALRAPTALDAEPDALNLGVEVK